MTLQQLRCFVAVVKYQSYHQAAKHLFISQPAVSHQIQMLERELELPLFDHSQRKAALTGAGHTFYEDAMDILDRVDMAVQRVRLAGGLGYLNVVCETVIQIPELPRILAEFHRQLPEVVINLTTDNRADSRNLLQKRMADIAIVPQAAVQTVPELAHIYLGKGRLFAAIPRNHPLSAWEQIDYPQLEGQTLILPDSYHCPPEFQEFQFFLREQLLDFRFSHAGSIEQVLCMIEAELGVAILPEFSLRKAPKIRYVPIRTERQSPLAAAWHTSNDSEQVQCFLKIVREIMCPEQT